MEPRAGRRLTIVAAAVSAFVGVVAGASLAGPYQLAASTFLAGLMGTIAFVDFRELRVPDALNVPGAVGGFVVAILDARWSQSPVLPALGWALLAMILCGGVFFLLREVFFRLRGVEGLGFGDVKLAATGGIWLGWELFAAATTVAAIVAIGWVAIAATLTQSWPRERKIPFAAFLAPAIWFAWVYARAESL